jgi:hypothetical protein
VGRTIAWLVPESCTERQAHVHQVLVDAALGVVIQQHVHDTAAWAWAGAWVVAGG